MSKTVIVYGNCQAEAVAAILRADPAAESRLRILYLRSFDHPSEGYGELRSEDVADCAVLLEQHDPRPFPNRDLLPLHCATAKFPAIDVNLLWPFFCVNPHDETDPALFPFGRFPYGDRIIVDCVDKQMLPEEILDYYLTAWERYGVDLDRLLQLESARLLARDANCDVKMGDYVLQRFAGERLFWTPNHPTSTLLRELIHRLLHACAKAEPALKGFDVDATVAYRFSPEGPLGALSVPVHPAIAGHFRSCWYDADARYQWFGGAAYSYTEYFEEMIRHSIAVKQARELQPPSQVAP